MFTLFFLYFCSILFDQEIAIHRKLPFIRLLNSTYLVTERDSEACATALANNLYVYSSYCINNYLPFQTIQQLLGLQ